jgi:hypothetical protein
MNLHFRKVLFLLVFCLTALPFSAWSASQKIGSAMAVKGDVKAETPEGRRSLEVNSPVFIGETLVSGPESRAQIIFLDETVLTLGPSSTILLDKYLFSPQDQGLLFKLGQGAFMAITGKIADQNPEKFKMETPLGLIGIRGTTIGFLIRDGQETIYALQLTTPHVIEVQGLAFPDIIVIMDQNGTAVDLIPGQPPMGPRPMREGEFDEETRLIPEVLSLIQQYLAESPWEGESPVDTDERLAEIVRKIEQAFAERYKEGEGPPARDDSPASPVLP